ncbi:hypothetical protein Trydic_g21545 [Trypoxylus dichotomus]
MSCCPILLQPDVPQVQSFKSWKKNCSNIYTYRFEVTVTVTTFSSKNEGPKIPVEEIAHRIMTLGFDATIGINVNPEAHVLFVDVSTQMETDFITKEHNCIPRNVFENRVACVSPRVEVAFSEFMVNCQLVTRTLCRIRLIERSGSPRANACGDLCERIDPRNN